MSHEEAKDVTITEKPSVPDSGVISVDGELKLASAHIRRDCNELKKYMECGGTFDGDEVDEMVRAMSAIIKNGSNREKIAAMKVLQAQAAMSIQLGERQNSAASAHLHLHQHTAEPNQTTISTVAGLLDERHERS